MQQRELIKTVANWLEESGINYMITGAWSVIFYGRTRTSHDLDFIVEMQEKDVSRLERILKRHADNFLFQAEAMAKAVSEKRMFQVTYLPSMEKIDFWMISQTEFDRSRFRRRRKVEAWGQPVYVPTPEDTILQKLLWYDKSKIEKHLIDAAFVYQLQKLNRNYLNKWAKSLKVEKYLPDLDAVDIEEHY